ncbi:MAG: NAD(P)(+) transhydrogenase (Re/Si-specific) subunit beta [Myxococcota bacterium]
MDWIDWKYLYLVATLAFVFGIKRLSKVKTAASGNRLAAIGMGIAVIAALILVGGLTWWMVIVGIGIGSAIGYRLAKTVPTTEMPELVAGFNGLGGVASTFVALASVASIAGVVADKRTIMDMMDMFGAATVPATLLIGTATFSGSILAYLKLGGKKMSHPLSGSNRHYGNIGLAAAVLILSLWMVYSTGAGGVWTSTILLVVVSLVLGCSLVMPIGGADMPVVVALLNSYSGIAASASGFIIGNQLLIVAGALVGASGLILTQIMCKAMNRSLTNVLLGGVGGDDAVAEDAREYENIKSSSAEEVAMLFDGASSVIMVPGYGLAVAQAQHTIRELGELLESRGVDVRYAIHPVAGRMPGHMNVLLAESDVSYDKLFELDDINSDFSNTDVVVVVGANDVVNPAAREDPTSPIAGMPILDVDKARTCVVIKRSLSPGYAGIKNPLFEKDNCLMVFDDAKVALEAMVREVKDL